MLVLQYDTYYVDLIKSRYAFKGIAAFLLYIINILKTLYANTNIIITFVIHDWVGLQNYL